MFTKGIHLWIKGILSLIIFETYKSLFIMYQR